MNEIKKIEKLLSDLAFNHMCLDTTYSPKSDKDNREYRYKMDNVIIEYLDNMIKLIDKIKKEG